MLSNSLNLMEQPNKLRFHRIHPDARLPTRATSLSAGLDLFLIEDVQIDPNCRVACRVGLSVEIPQGYYGRIAPRSGLATKFGIDVLAGVIDSDYRGEIICVLINHGDSSATFKAGDRIAQLVIECISLPMPEWSDNLATTDRANRGFGSSDG
jgi:dUTP pyrophosphatase